MRGRRPSRGRKERRRDGPLTAPTNEVERAVTDVWRELFGVDRISLDDNFFELGGHSLLLVRAHAQLQDKFRADLPDRRAAAVPDRARARALLLAGGARATPSTTGDRTVPANSAKPLRANAI